MPPSQGGRSCQAFIEYKLKLFFHQGHISYIGTKNVLHVFANCYKKEFSGTWEAVFCLKFLLWMPNFYSWHFSPNLMKKLILQYTDDSTLWMQFVFTYKIWSSRENWYNSYKKGSRVSGKQCRFILWFVGITGCIKLSRQRIRIFSDLNSRDDIRGTVF